MSLAVDTQTKLTDAALRLFADRGVFNVSLAEVVREAGQRNASAIHYHFGSRDQLLLAILEPHAAFLRTRRRELLAPAELTNDPRAAVEVIVRPLVELARHGWQARARMKIGLELADHPDRVTPELDALLQRTGGREVLSLLAARCPSMPGSLWTLRTNICIGFVARAATERARIIDDHPRQLRATLDDEAFVQNLIDMFLAALTAAPP